MPERNHPAGQVDIGTATPADQDLVFFDFRLQLVMKTGLTRIFNDVQKFHETTRDGYLK